MSPPKDPSQPSASAKSLKSHDPTISGEAPARRGFFTRFFTGLLGFLVVAIPGFFGGAFFLDPLLRKRRGESAEASTGGGPVKDGEGYLLLNATIASLPADGTPVSYTVYDDKLNAWNRLANVQIGTIWLRRLSDAQVIAFSSVCPHLGCAVDFRTSKGDFFCPCHTSSFNLDGVRTNQIPPRGMDVLPTKLKPDTGDRIWLKYETFRAGTAEKTPVI